MNMRLSLLIPICWAVLHAPTDAAVITVTTTNNLSPAANQVSLLQALQRAQSGDEIQFNIPGAGPHYIATPEEGYPVITNNITLNGYSQPGSLPNTNAITAANTAQIRIVLDSRAGGHRVMALELTSPNDDPGYAAADAAILAVAGATDFRVEGVSLLGAPLVGPDDNRFLHMIAFAKGASGRVQGCWLGVDPDRTTVSAGAYGISGFRYRGRDAVGAVTNTLLVNNLIIGVEPRAAAAARQFNVLAGMTVNPVLIEGHGTRIAGNFITVLPDGLRDYNVALDPALAGQFRGAVSIGRGGNNSLIGTDGDGVNDANERNILGGMLPASLQGYEHLIEFYGQDPGTNIVVAGNYIGVGIDGNTRFTNGVPALNGSGPASEYRIGSNFDGVSDVEEGNLIANHHPRDLFPPESFAAIAEALSFFSQLNAGATVSLRGNSLLNNFPFPASPLRDGGAFLSSYYSKALLDPGAYLPVLTESTRQRLRGSVPVPDPAAYIRTVVDVYVADLSGITNGMAAGIPELPDGFVQGQRYLQSFTEGSGQDQEPDPGVFEFDISQLNLPAGTRLTVTANYIPGVSVGEAGVFTGITRGEGGVTLSWTSGTLQSAPSVVGPWADENVDGTTVTIPPTAPLRFYRLAGGGPVASAAALPLTSPFSNPVPIQ